jgi:N utilization substance protein B
MSDVSQKQSRSASREQGFFLIFERVFNKDLLEDIIDSAELSRDLVFDEYAKTLARGVENNEEKIDSLIESHLKKGWTINRISKPSLAILRLALYEMLYEESVPASVAINEAVELAKEYTIDESKFVNGILGAIAREL